MLKNDKNKNIYSEFDGIEGINSNCYTQADYFDPNSSYTNRMQLLKSEFGITRNLPTNSKLRLKKHPLVNNNDKNVNQDVNMSANNTTVASNTNTDIAIDNNEEDDDFQGLGVSVEKNEVKEDVEMNTDSSNASIEEPIATDQLLKD